MASDIYNRHVFCMAPCSSYFKNINLNIFMFSEISIGIIFKMGGKDITGWVWGIFQLKYEDY